DKASDYLAVIDITPYFSRSSALASKASGLPAARLSAMAAAGMTLDEIKTSAGEPISGYKENPQHIAVRMPKWDFEKLKGSRDLLDIQKKSTGEAIGIGKTYREALQKAAASLDKSGLDDDALSGKTAEQLSAALRMPSSKRHFIIYRLLKMGADVSRICEITGIDSFFINEMKELALLDEQLCAFRGGTLPESLLVQAKKNGFTDRYIAKAINSTEHAIRSRRAELKLFAGIGDVNGYGQHNSGFFYCSYNIQSGLPQPQSEKKKLVVLASGYCAIGQGTEYDNSVVNACQAFRELGFEAIVINCAPGAASTDAGVADKLYIEPLDAEHILNICQAEKPYGIIAQFAGENAPRLAAELASAGARVVDSYASRLSFAENYALFAKTAQKLNIPVYPSAEAQGLAGALKAADETGCPAIASISTSCGEKTVKIVYSRQDLETAFKTMLDDENCTAAISRFYPHATAAQADVLSDGENIFIPAVSEHIELAGIHSGDSAAVIPSATIPQKHIDAIRRYSALIAKELGVCGLCSLHYSIAGDTVYLAAAELYASRSVPIAAKVCGINMAKAAAAIIAGKINGVKFDMGSLACSSTGYCGVKEAVFPFGSFPEVDPALGPEMRSTGSVLGLADSFGLAFFRAQEAAQASIPLSGRVLISVNNEDKQEALIAANAFKQMGFEVLATSGTHRWLKENGVDSTYVYKLDEGRPNILDEIINGKIDIIINTPATTQGLNDDSYIRKAAIKNKVFYMTTMAAAIAAVKGINAVRGTTHFIAKPLHEYHGSNQ
ncbi:MAG TPA: carbamoyl-phosphate synthase large subunit, partial [Ruminococcaceae bacterium]|nr:carbamoyl-phosphate synthase large subunit [Oscillospiraceae bacterium]